MSISPTNETLKQLHWQLAVDCNNRAWELASKSSAAVDKLELLNLAHTSAYHWKQVGTQLNVLRSYELLAHAHALCGNGTTATMYSNLVLDYFAMHDSDQWEVAITQMIAAHAAHLCENMTEYQAHYRQALKVLEAMDDGEEKDVVMLVWQHVPIPE